MTPDEIIGRETLEAWLNTRPQADALAIAYRSAMRVLPIVFEWEPGLPAHERHAKFLSVLRATMTAGVAHKFLTNEVRSALAFAAAASNLNSQSIEEVAISACVASTAVVTGSAASAAVSYASQATSLYASKGRLNLSYMAGIRDMMKSRAEASIWQQSRLDALAVEKGVDPQSQPLWSENTLSDLDAIHSAQGFWQTDPRLWSFWQRWYQAALAGTPLNWEMQRDIAVQIKNEDWEAGPARVAERIAEIESLFDSNRAPFDLRQNLSAMPPASKRQVAITRAAMQQNREVMPPTFDAIEGLIALEIERLQGRNYVDDFDRDETHRQISILVTLYEAIGALRSELPAAKAVTEVQAENSERLVRLYMRKFAELPRAKADEVVEGVWKTGRGIVQAGLIGATTALAVSYGLGKLAGVAIGAMIFAPRSVPDVVKAAKEALTPTK